MAVQLANTQLAVRTRPLLDVTDPAGFDVHGARIPAAATRSAGPWPGRVPSKQRTDTWVLAVDPQAWPVRAGDAVVEPSTGREWTVTAADLRLSAVNPMVDYVRVEGHLVVSGGTEP